MLLPHPRLLLSIVSARQVLRWASLLLTSAHLLLYKTTQLHLEILLVDVLSELLLGHVEKECNSNVKTKVLIWVDHSVLTPFGIIHIYNVCKL